MDNYWELPKSITLDGINYKIRTDFRDIINILVAFNDNDLTNTEKAQVMLEIFYIDYDKIPFEFIEEAIEKAIEFIDCGIANEGRQKKKLMDWKQDAPVIASAVNKVVGYEIRSAAYVHWWTFMGAYLEVGDGLFAQIVNIRNKKIRGKRLEKWEQTFYRENKALIDFKVKNERSNEELKELRQLFGYK